MPVTTRRILLSAVLTALVALVVGCGEQGQQPVAPSPRGLEPAVLWGENDGTDHPWVGVTVFREGGSWFICSGSLIAPDVFLTAGHCTADADESWVTFGNPWTPPITALPPPGWLPGTPHAHPAYDNFATFPNTSDVGVVILDAPLNGGPYGQLAAVGALDGLTTQRGLQNQIFDVVGYGDSGPFPRVTFDSSRYQGHPKLVELNSANTGGFNIHLSGNPGVPHRGAQCFGDSGGPALVPGTDDVVAGVGSFVINRHCVGAGFYYRVDTDHAQDWLNTFLP